MRCEISNIRASKLSQQERLNTYHLWYDRKCPVNTKLPKFQRSKYFVVHYQHFDGLVASIIFLIHPGRQKLLLLLWGAMCSAFPQNEEPRIDPHRSDGCITCRKVPKTFVIYCDFFLTLRFCMILSQSVRDFSK